MRPRVIPLLVLVAVLGSACASHPAGPATPVGPDQVTPDDAVKAAGAREAARRFVEAYAEATGGDSTALQAMVGTDLLARWVHWLDIQNREFPGTISGTVSSNQIGPAAPFSVSSVPGSEAILRQVDVAATVTFSFDPSNGTPETVTRSLDGPMRLILDPRNGWKVLDFTRDGIPLSREFQTMKGAAATVDGVKVEAAAFLSVPYWQFGLVVVDPSSGSVDAKRTAIVDASGAVVSAAKAVTDSLERLPGGVPTEGLVTFSPASSADGLTLRIVVRSTTGHRTTLEIPLSGKVTPVPIATPTPTPSG